MTPELLALLEALRDGADVEAIRAAARLIAALLPGQAEEATARLLNLAAKVEAHAELCIDW